MGRGRQKAKNMKVARKLKYYSPEPDLGALQRELTGSDITNGPPKPSVDDEDEDAYWDDSAPTDRTSGWSYDDWDDSSR